MVHNRPNPVMQGVFLLYHIHQNDLKNNFSVCQGMTEFELPQKWHSANIYKTGCWYGNWSGFRNIIAILTLHVQH